ncbi:hypothetical protein MUK42_34875 [Musa troglodytarum]|uniref:Uncharacterized protein n=1 Tax=Musa troglodytarum TaxID=320322 RepID=A0A9E7JYZ4_9LILI|nr:hypothetical protein MUK42_34875 [Musa troglodytarum]
MRRRRRRREAEVGRRSYEGSQQQQQQQQQQRRNPATNLHRRWCESYASVARKLETPAERKYNQ